MNIIHKIFIKLFVKKNVISFDLESIFVNFEYEINWELIRILKIFKKLGYRIALIREDASTPNNHATTQNIITKYWLPVDIVKFTNFEDKGVVLKKIGTILHFNKLGSEEEKILNQGIYLINVFQDGFVGIE